jgi:hypothetical protein
MSEIVVVFHDCPLDHDSTEDPFPQQQVESLYKHLEFREVPPQGLETLDSSKSDQNLSLASELGGC